MSASLRIDTIDPAVIRDLLERVRATDGRDGGLNAAIACTFIFRDLRPAQPGDHGERPEDFSASRITGPHGWLLADPYTSNRTAAVDLIRQILPNFWHTGGLCAKSGHASIGPDYNGPAGAELRQVWPEATYHAGFDADHAPGGDPCREATALLDCAFQAVLARLADLRRCPICNETAPTATLCLFRIAGAAVPGEPCDYSLEGEARLAAALAA